MPTASTSQILGYNECIEPITSNIYSRRTIAGEFVVANKYLMKELIDLNIWNEKIKNSIVANNGSIQQIETIPQEIRNKYKTVWEIPMRNLIDMAADRGAYICQSQSMNLFLENPNFSKLSSMHFYAWKKGLKTGMYYLRSKAAVDPIKFTVAQNLQESRVSKTSSDGLKVENTQTNNDATSMDANTNTNVEMKVEDAPQVCSLDDPDCLMCGS